MILYFQRNSQKDFILDSINYGKIKEIEFYWQEKGKLYIIIFFWENENKIYIIYEKWIFWKIQNNCPFS